MSRLVTRDIFVGAVQRLWVAHRKRVIKVIEPHPTPSNESSVIINNS